MSVPDWRQIARVWRTIFDSLEKFGAKLPRVLHSVTEFNSLAAHRYVPQAYDGKVTLFWASGDLRASNDLVKGWRALATGGIEVQEIPGTHLDIIKEPHVDVLAKKLTECLQRASVQNRECSDRLEASADYADYAETQGLRL